MSRSNQYNAKGREVGASFPLLASLSLALSLRMHMYSQLCSGCSNYLDLLLQTLDVCIILVHRVYTNARIRAASVRNLKLSVNIPALLYAA